MSRRTKENRRTLRDVLAAGVANLDFLTHSDWPKS